VKEICHNRKKEKLVIHVLYPLKVVKLVVKVIAQHVKLTRVPLRYPCIICFSFEHCAFDYPRKIEVQNMFQTKQTTIVTIITKNHKIDYVVVNVINVVMTLVKYQSNRLLKNVNW
jgi:hypothetical protein